MAHDVFISYASEDKAIADAVCARLEQAGIRCWIAPRNIQPGADWPSSIVAAIRQASALVLIFSTHANHSREIPREITQAAKHGLSILTFRVEDVVPAGSLDYTLSTVHWLDALTPPLERHIEQLEQTLRPLLDARGHVGGPQPTDRQRLGFGAAVVLAFAATGLALDVGPVPGAALFGFALSILLLRDWRERTFVTGVAWPVYWVARQSVASNWVPAPDVAQYTLAGVFGAAMMTLALAIWRPRMLRAAPWAAAAGAVGGALFVVPVLGRFGHTSWQLAVGITLVQWAMRQSPSPVQPRLSQPLRIAAVAVAVTALTLGVNLYFDRTRPEEFYAGQTQTNPKDGLPYNWAPPGSFEIGCSPDDSDCYGDELPSHTVTLTKGFWLGDTEVTVGAWRRVMGTMPPEPVFLGHSLNAGWAEENLPISNVTWPQAFDYCTAVDGRLPTEAEWEYAARASTTGARFGRLNDIAWYANNSGAEYLNADTLPEDRFGDQLAANGNRPHAVDSASGFHPWSLSDMLGNVSEWVADDYGDRTYAARVATGGTTDPFHVTGVSGAAKIARGGSWYQPARSVRASARRAAPPETLSSDIGFRCVWNKPAE